MGEAVGTLPGQQGQVLGFAGGIASGWVCALLGQFQLPSILNDVSFIHFQTKMSALYQNYEVLVKLFRILFAKYFSTVKLS